MNVTTCEEVLKELSLVRVSISSTTINEIYRTARVSFSSQLANLGSLYTEIFQGVALRAVSCSPGSSSGASWVVYMITT